MKIKNYEEAIEYVEQHRDEMLGFIASEEKGCETLEALFEQFAQGASFAGRTPDEQLWFFWGYYKERFEKALEIQKTLHQFFYGESNAPSQQSQNS
jgi:hypothetical protein